jgi:membrane protein DedA with SNARE-associated domain
MPEFLTNLLNLLHASRYAILFFGAIFEGPVLMLTSGFLIRLGQLELVPAH